MRSLVDGKEVVEHFVKPEVRYIKGPEEVTARLKRAGWEYRTFQARPAMERMTCVDCLRVNEVRDEVWGGLRDEAKRLEPPKDVVLDGFYQDLCEG